MRLTCPMLWMSRLLCEPAQTWPLTLVQHGPDQRELLVMDPGRPRARGAEDQHELRLEVHLMQTLPLEPPPLAPRTAGLWIAPDGRWCGHYQAPQWRGLAWPVELIGEWFLPGAGQHQLLSAQPSRFLARSSGSTGSRQGWDLACGVQATPDGRFSRPAGALGGWAAVKAQRLLRYGLVGCGRSGFAMASQLAAWAPFEVVLFDFDRLEPGNLDTGLMVEARDPEADASSECDSINKAQALAAHLVRLAPDTRVRVVPQSISSPLAQRVLATCDLVISAPDNDPARLPCAAVASAFHRVHLDLGALASVNGAGEVELGADIRLFVPGDRDLCCLGGFADPLALEDQAPQQTAPPAPDWRAAKVGALTSWSTLVASLGMRLLEDLAAERLQHSQWIRLTQTAGASMPRIEALTAGPDRYCPLCAVAGHGDAPLGRLRDLAAAAVIRARRSGALGMQDP